MEVLRGNIDQFSAEVTATDVLNELLKRINRIDSSESNADRQEYRNHLAKLVARLSEIRGTEFDENFYREDLILTEEDESTRQVLEYIDMFSRKMYSIDPMKYPYADEETVQDFESKKNMVLISLNFLKGAVESREPVNVVDTLAKTDKVIDDAVQELNLSHDQRLATEFERRQSQYLWYLKFVEVLDQVISLRQDVPKNVREGLDKLLYDVNQLSMTNATLTPDEYMTISAEISKEITSLSTWVENKRIEDRNRIASDETSGRQNIEDFNAAFRINVASENRAGLVRLIDSTKQQAREKLDQQVKTMMSLNLFYETNAIAANDLQVFISNGPQQINAAEYGRWRRGIMGQLARNDKIIAKLAPGALQEQENFETSIENAKQQAFDRLAAQEPNLSGLKDKDKILYETRTLIQQGPIGSESLEEWSDKLENKLHENDVIVMNRFAVKQPTGRHVPDPRVEERLAELEREEQEQEAILHAEILERIAQQTKESNDQIAMNRAAIQALQEQTRLALEEKRRKDAIDRENESRMLEQYKVDRKNFETSETMPRKSLNTTEAEERKFLRREMDEERKMIGMRLKTERQAAEQEAVKRAAEAKTAAAKQAAEERAIAAKQAAAIKAVTEERKATERAMAVERAIAIKAAAAERKAAEQAAAAERKAAEQAAAIEQARVASVAKIKAAEQVATEQARDAAKKRTVNAQEAAADRAVAVRNMAKNEVKNFLDIQLPLLEQQQQRLIQIGEYRGKWYSAIEQAKEHAKRGYVMGIGNFDGWSNELVTRIDSITKSVNSLYQYIHNIKVAAREKIDVQASKFRRLGIENGEKIIRETRRLVEKPKTESYVEWKNKLESKIKSNSKIIESVENDKAIEALAALAGEAASEDVRVKAAEFQASAQNRLNLLRQIANEKGINGEAQFAIVQEVLNSPPPAATATAKAYNEWMIDVEGYFDVTVELLGLGKEE